MNPIISQLEALKMPEPTDPDNSLQGYEPQWNNAAIDKAIEVVMANTPESIADLAKREGYVKRTPLFPFIPWSKESEILSTPSGDNSLGVNGVQSAESPAGQVENAALGQFDSDAPAAIKQILSTSASTSHEQKP